MNCRGAGEMSRLILKVAKIEFNDIRYTVKMNEGMVIIN